MFCIEPIQPKIIVCVCKCHNKMHQITANTQNTNVYAQKYAAYSEVASKCLCIC